VGKPYSYGGAGPDSFDTSGFIRYCCNEITGTSLPHSVIKQADMGTRVEKDDLLPGDVVFFWTSNPEAVEYVGIYVGNGQIVAARNPENPVSQMNMNVPYFTERYLFACRYW
jgi:cell wall-associated NlpC family hydrolase